MKFSFLLTAIFILSGCATSEPITEHPSASLLVGVWKVDLRPLPGSSEYYKELVVNSVDGKTFNGTFYDAPISEARINTDWGAVRIAFDTADRSGSYHHSAVLKNGRMEGLSNSTGRNFLSYWSAEKK